MDVPPAFHPTAIKLRGFTLIELSIVLVIIGLIVGGVLVGRSLIRAAEIRSVVTDIQSFETAIYTFRLKYGGVPGDFSNATTFWGKDNATCPTHTGTAAVPGTCNGNGDKGVTAGEDYRAWQQLALGGLIAGTYTGLPSVVPGSLFWPGENAPPARFTRSGYRIRYASGFAGGSYPGNYIDLGSTAHTQFKGALFTPLDAKGIDLKIDDGLAQSGRMFAQVGTGNTGQCNTDTVGGDWSYNLSNTSVACYISYKIH